MTVQFSEGFETIKSSYDLIQSKGWNQPSVATPGPSWYDAPARYVGGNALHTLVNTGGTSSHGPRKLAGTAKNGGFSIGFSAMYSTLNNNLGFFSPPVWGNNEYVWVSNAGTNYVMRAETNWTYSTEIGIGTASAINTAFRKGIIWNEERGLYFLMGGTSSSAIWYNTNSTYTGWGAPTNIVTTSSGVAGQCLALYEINGHIFYISRVICCLPAGADPATGWVNFTLPVASGVIGICYDGTKYIMCGSGFSNTIFTTTDPTTGTWTRSGTIANSTGSCAAYGAGRIVFTNNNYFSVSSDGGVTFQRIMLPDGLSAGTWNIAYGNDVFVAVPVGSTGVALISEDGVNWEPYYDPSIGSINSSDSPYQLTFQNGYFMMPGQGRIPMRSVNGRNWERLSVSSPLGASTQIAPMGLFSTANASTSRNIGFVGYTASTAGLSLWGNQTPSGGSVIQSLQNNHWYTLELLIQRLAPTQYRVDCIVDGEQALTQTFTEAQWQLDADIGPGISSNVGFNMCGDGSGTWVVGSNSGNLYVTHNDWSTINTVTKPSVVSIPGFTVWTGARFINFEYNQLDAAWISSVDGDNWSVIIPSISGVPSANRMVVHAQAHHGTVIALGGTDLPGVFRFTESTGTWSFIAVSGGSYARVRFIPEWDKWIAVGTTSIAVSEDDGLTWSVVANPVPITTLAADMASWGELAYFKGYVFYLSSTSAVLGRINQDLEVDTFNEPINAFPVSNGDYLIAMNLSSKTLYGTNDPNGTWAAATGGGVRSIAVNPRGKDVFYFNASGCHHLYPEWMDIQWYFQLGGGFSDIDDIVFTDMETPNAGPQGSCRIMRLPDDTAIQSDWTPVPSDLTNVEAATQVPATNSTSFIETSTDGATDIYGGTFEIPSGLRPVSVQVEATVERRFVSTPKVQLGIQVDGVQDMSDPIPITTPVGTKMTITRTLTTDPSTGNSWTKDGVENAQSVIKRVG